MYGYEEEVNISIYDILEEVSQEDIFGLIFKKPIIVGDYYTSPFRKDDEPGCRFEYFRETLYFVDFGDSKNTHRTCFQAISEYFKLSHRDTIRYVANSFGISTYKEVPLFSNESLPLESIKKKSKDLFHINFIKKPFTRPDKIFWSQFLITLDQLQEDGIFSVQSYSLNGGNYFTPRNLCFCITLPNNPRVKLYQPQRDKKDFKWITNFTNNDIGNLDNISQSGRKLIITSSYKDHRVLRNVNLKDVLWFQAEGQIPCDRLNIELIERFEKIYFFYDNDEPGREAAKKLAEAYNFYRKDCAIPITFPERCPWKDPAQYINKEGKQDLIFMLKQMNLYEDS